MLTAVPLNNYTFSRTPKHWQTVREWISSCGAVILTGKDFNVESREAAECTRVLLSALAVGWLIEEQT